MAKIVVKSEFCSELDTDYSFSVTEYGLEDSNADFWIKFDELPEFIAWLQAEYDKQKAGN